MGHHKFRGQECPRHTKSRSFDSRLVIGKSDPSTFEAVRSCVTPEILRISGGSAHQNPHGLPCELAISFKFHDGAEGGFGFRYGSESEGPPENVRTLVTEAARLTDAWHREFKRRAQEQPGT